LPPLRGSLDQPQASGAAQLDLAGRIPRVPLRDSNSARLNLRSLAADRGGAQGKKSKGPKSLSRKVGIGCPPTGLENESKLFGLFSWNFCKHRNPISIIIGVRHKAQFFRFTKIGFANCWRSLFKTFIKQFDTHIAVFNHVPA
jgi:hypothetical protein